MKKALILTNQMTKFAGSEIVALEVAESLHELGFSVAIRTNAMSSQVAGSTLNDIIFSDAGPLIELDKYDLIWMQHNLVSHFDLTTAFKRNVSGRFFSVHLSPYENLELTGLSSGLALSASFVCNSWETQQKLISIGICKGDILNFKNAAPRRFFRIHSTTSPQLNRLLVVSNHLPKEVSDALLMLECEGVVVRRLGMRHEHRRITPEDVFSSDAILSIGKTVQYGILAGIPVFCYDRFGGPGWLCRESFDVAERYNFSGRCCQTKLSPEEIYQSLRRGYGFAREEAIELKKAKGHDFILENFLQSMLRPRDCHGEGGGGSALLSCAAANSAVIRNLYRRIDRRKRRLASLKTLFAKLKNLFR